MRRLMRPDLMLAAAGLLAWHAGPLASVAVAVLLVAAAALLTRKAR